MKLALDWRAYDAYGEGDAYAAVPKSGEGFGKAAALCIGSRQCQKARGEAGDKGVMCPSFRIRHDELHSTRGRAALLRQALDGELGEAPFAGPELAAAMDLCVACKGCKRECPNGVDMAALRAETLAQRWQTQTPPWRTRLMATLPQWLPRLAGVPGLRGLIALRNRVPALARLGERLTGVAARRSLPVPAARPFHRREAAIPANLAATATSSTTATASGDAASAAPREVALLVDCFANHLDPAVAEAAVQVLRAAGLVVHPVVAAAAEGGHEALCCGRAAWSAGFVDRARDQARTLLAALAPHLAAGRPVIGLEPSCLSMLRDEVHLMGLDPDAVQALGRQALMLEEYLARELDAKRLALPLQPLPATAWVHGHCHQKAFGTLKSLRKLLAQVPQLQLQWIESSCCGMAGSFGYEAEHHADSMAMAELALLPAVRAAAPEALLLASGTSCRHQIRDGAQRESLHLAQLLQAALPHSAGSGGASGAAAGHGVPISPGALV